MGRPCKCCNKEDCENCQCFDSYKFEEDPDRYDWMLVICNSNAIQDDLWDLYIQHPTRDEEDEVEYYIGAVDNIGKDECSSNIFCTNEEMIEEAKDFCDLQLCCINNSKITVVDKDIFNFCGAAVLRFVCTKINNSGNFGTLTVIRRDKQRGEEYCRLLSTNYSQYSPPETGSSFSIDFIQECCAKCQCLPYPSSILNQPPFKTRPFYISCTLSDFSSTYTSTVDQFYSNPLETEFVEKVYFNHSVSINSAALSSIYYSELCSKANETEYLLGTDKLFSRDFCFTPGTRSGRPSINGYMDLGLESYSQTFDGIYQLQNIPDPIPQQRFINNPLFTRTNFEKDSFPSKEFFNPYTDEKFYFYAIEPELKQVTGTYTRTIDEYRSYGSFVNADYAIEETYDVYSYIDLTPVIHPRMANLFRVYSTAFLNNRKILRNNVGLPVLYNTLVGSCLFEVNDWLDNNNIYQSFSFGPPLGNIAVQTKNYVFSPRMAKSLFSCHPDGDDFFNLIETTSFQQREQIEKGLQDGHRDVLSYINEDNYSKSIVTQTNTGTYTQSITRSPIFGLIQGGEFEI